MNLKTTVMKKSILVRISLLVLLCGALSTSKSQPELRGPVDPVRVGSLTINAGIGLGVPYSGSLGMPFGVKAAVDWGLADLGNGVITLGISSGASVSHGDRDDVSINSSRVFILGRAAWHYGWELRGLDFYGGLSSGVGLDRFHFGSPVDNTTRSAHLVAGIFVGGSFFLTPGFGLNAELGDDITIAQFGIIVRPH
jgi:hypothetical protein